MESNTVIVSIHPSQFPDQVRRDLIESLRNRQINHKFHYESVGQTQKWLALHEAFSPARRDADCLATYDRCFKRAAELIECTSVCVVGLGCGGGQKDTRLIGQLLESGRQVEYLPVDVGTAMVLTARQNAQGVLNPEGIRRPLVCDLAKAVNLPKALDDLVDPASSRLITFFGMLPNFPPRTVLRRIAGLLRSEEWLLLSANLGPGSDYGRGVRKVLAQYDNALTRDWLMTFLRNIGVPRTSGQIEFAIKPDFESPDLLRIVADFVFVEPCEIKIDDESFRFEPRETIQLFYSYRFTPEKVVGLLSDVNLEIEDQWITASGEEGVFLCRRR